MKTVPKKILSFILAISLVFTMVPALASAASTLTAKGWENFADSGISTAHSGDAVLTKDSGGNPWIVYQDSETYKAVVKKYNGTNWEAVGNSEISDSTPDFLAIAVSPTTGTPYVAYRDDMNGSLLVKELENGVWNTVGNFPSCINSRSSLDFDSNGKPYLAYCDAYGAMYVEKLDGSNWDSVGSLETNPAHALYASIKIIDDTPYVAYVGSHSHKLNVIKYSNSEWSAIGSTDFSEAADNSSVSFAINSSGTPYVAYQSDDGAGEITVMNYNGSNWQSTGASHFMKGGLQTLTFALDSNGTPYVAFIDETKNGKPTVMQYSNNTWSVTGYAGFSADPIYCGRVFILIDDSNTPMVAFSQGTDQALTLMTECDVPACTLTYNPGDHGSFSGSSSEIVPVGRCPQASIVPIPDSGYTFVGWTSDGGKTVLTSSQLASQTVTQDITYTACYANCYWENVFPSDTGNSVSSVMDKNGMIYMAYTVSMGESHQTSIMKFDGIGGWQKLGDSISSAQRPSIAIDSNGTPYVAVVQTSNPNNNGFVFKASVLEYTSGSWQNVGSANFSKGSIDRISLAIDSSSNTPYVAFNDDSNGGKATVMKHTGNGTGWEAVGSADGISEGSIDEDSFCLAINGGIPYIAYINSIYSRSENAGKATVLKYTGSNGWETVGKSGFSSSSISNVSLAFGQNGIPYAVCDLTNAPSGSNCSSVLEFTGITESNSTGWSTVGTNGFADGKTSNSKIAFSQDGTFFVAYISNGKLTVRKFDGTNWVNFSNSDLSVSSSYPINLMLNKGTPYVAYSNNNSVLVKRYVKNIFTVAYQAGEHGSLVGNSSASETVAPNTSPKAIPGVKPDTGYCFLGWSCGGGSYYLTSLQLATLRVGADVTFTACFGPAGNSNPAGNPSGNSPTSSDTHSSTTSYPDETKVDPVTNTVTVTTKPSSVSVSGNTAQIETTATNLTTDDTGTSTNGVIADTAKEKTVTIDLPADAISQQFAAKKDVDLTLTVPSSVAKDNEANTKVNIHVDSSVFSAARQSGNDLTLHVKDADTQQVAYTWTFKGADLGKSSVPATDVNISMAIRLTTEVPQVSKTVLNNKGLVLMFDHSGVLPSTASVTFSAKEKGFQPGEKFYFYYYNKTTGQIEPQGQQYTVDANGMVTVLISHCSNYVLLPNPARTITLDTRSYTLSPNASYITGVKLAGASGTKIIAYSSAKGVADVTVLSSGNVKATGLKPGLTYIMIDVYDNKNKLLTHASVHLTVRKGIKSSGSSTKQYGIF